MNIGAFAENLEKEVGTPCIRYIRVIEETKTRKDGSKYKKKIPFGEKNNMTPQAISLFRGYDIRSSNPTQCFTDYSLYLKHMPGIWCIDIDTKADDVLAKELPQRMIDAGCFATETNKGYHFYIKCPDAPTDFTNEIEVFKDFKGDFLGRDLGCNVWEKKTRKLDGNHIMEFEWSDLSQYLDIEKMNEESRADKKKRLKLEKAKARLEKLKADNEPDPEGINSPFTDGQVQSYLDRIKNVEGHSKHYDDWLKIGACLYNTYQGKNKGLRMWIDWSSKSPKHDEDQNEESWETFKKDHPDPAGWKTLRFMADTDSPTNIYQGAFMSRKDDGFNAQKDAVAELMNERIMWNRMTKEYIQVYDDIQKTEEGRWGSYKNQQMVEEFEKHCFFAEGPNGKPREYNPFDLWKKSPKRKEVRCIEFDPKNPDNPNIFNLWQGYAISPEEADVYDEDDAQPLIDHIFRIWCQGREDHFTYVINWFAHILQRPWHKMGVLLALQSEEGAGKGVVMEAIARIMGSCHFSATANANSIIGDFNGGLEAKCLVDLDEAVWGGDIKQMGKMKNIITEQSQEVNKKHKEAYKIKNSTNFMITTNNDLFAGVEKGARRYACFRLDDRYAGVATQESNEYFRQIRGGSTDSCPSLAVCGAFAKYLYKRDLSAWSCRQLPRTDLLQDQIERGWNSVVRWWWDMLQDGRWGLPDYNEQYKNCLTGYGDAIKKTEYDVNMEYFGFVKDKVNGRITTEAYSEIVGIKKYWQRKDFNGSIMPQDGETKKQFLKRVYLDPSNDYRYKHMAITDSNGYPKEYAVKWEGFDIPLKETKYKEIYKGYNPKWLWEVYCDAVKSNKVGHSRSPETYNAWCQKMRKITDVNTRKHGSGSNQETTWECHTLADCREKFNRSQSWTYNYDEEDEVITPQNGGKIVETDGPGQQLPHGCLIDIDSDDDPVAE